LLFAFVAQRRLRTSLCDLRIEPDRRDGLARCEAYGKVDEARALVPEPVATLGVGGVRRSGHRRSVDEEAAGDAFETRGGRYPGRRVGANINSG
jgi:hypothetical protein